MTDDIVAFIRARQDEDERIARGCQHQEWEVDGSIRPKGGSGWEQVVDWVYDDDGTTREHIARHDPARVLREVEANRRLLAFLVDLESRELGGEWWQLNQRHPAPIQLLAVAWANHPDYRPAWAPDAAEPA